LLGANNNQIYVANPITNYTREALVNETIWHEFIKRQRKASVCEDKDCDSTKNLSQCDMCGSFVCSDCVDVDQCECCEEKKSLIITRFNLALIRSVESLAARAVSNSHERPASTLWDQPITSEEESEQSPHNSPSLTSLSGQSIGVDSSSSGKNETLSTTSKESHLITQTSSQASEQVGQLKTPPEDLVAKSRLTCIAIRKRVEECLLGQQVLFYLQNNKELLEVNTYPSLNAGLINLRVTIVSGSCSTSILLRGKPFYDMLEKSGITKHLSNIQIDVLSVKEFVRRKKLRADITSQLNSGGYR
jgi:hypothetical protein